MTKEELLKKIDFEKKWLYDCGIFGSDVDIAFHAIKNKVIEALEQEECEDAISRQAVIDILDDMTKDYAKSNDFEKVNGVAWVKVQKLPSVNPPKTGHWIKLTDYHFSNISYMGECSECGDTVLIYEDEESEWKYCPNCGCHMVETQESEVSK